MKLPTIGGVIQVTAGGIIIGDAVMQSNGVQWIAESFLPALSNSPLPTMAEHMAVGYLAHYAYDNRKRLMQRFGIKGNGGLPEPGAVEPFVPTDAREVMELLMKHIDPATGFKRLWIFEPLLYHDARWKDLMMPVMRHYYSIRLALMGEYRNAVLHMVSVEALEESAQKLKDRGGAYADVRIIPNAFVPDLLREHVNGFVVVMDKDDRLAAFHDLYHDPAGNLMPTLVYVNDRTEAGRSRIQRLLASFEAISKRQELRELVKRAA